MNAMPVAAAILLAAAQQSGPQKQPESIQREIQEQAREKSEAIRQAANRINGLAGNIRSEDDARGFVDAVAEQFSQKEHQSWTTRGIRHRVAHAEYEAVRDPSRLIPEQRIVDIWNEYVRELDAPEETLVTVEEVHNLRDAMYTSSQLMWKRETFPHSLWTVPDIYAVGIDGKVAGGCRAVEALKIFHDMFRFSQSVQGARERVQKGVFVSDLVLQREQDQAPRLRVLKSQIGVLARANPVMSAEYRYVQAHGERDYMRLLERLFAELFPVD